jgi:glucose-6-phosphate isomerase
MALDLLRARAHAAHGRRILDLFAADPHRVSRLTAECAGLRLDVSKQNIAADDLEALLSTADAAGFASARAALFGGEIVNPTEGRAALHMALRDPARAWAVLGAPVSDQVRQTQARVRALAEAIRSGRHLGAAGKPLNSVVHIGIGGSDLGPRLVHEALAPLDGGPVALRFAANVEPTELAAALTGLDPHTTMVVVVSKTFTTRETGLNFDAARAWLAGALPEADLGAHLAAVTAAPARAIERGFATDQIFPFWDWVGGRFSVWSSVSLSLEIALGPEAIAALRAGAAQIDRHFETSSGTQNLSLLAALTGVWNRSALGYPTRAVIPYSRRLRLLPQFLSQLDMESNGKSVCADGAPAEASCPVVWGAEGTNAQHAFFQHLHQSPDVTPVEFLAVLDDAQEAPERHAATLANAFAQAEALMRGKSESEARAENEAQGMPAERARLLARHRTFPGNRPSSFVTLDRLDARGLGALLAWHEHRTFSEGVLWGVNSFDQWGVELGKALAGEIEARLAGAPGPTRDPSTEALISRARAAR